MTAVSKYDRRKDAIIRVATDIMNHKGVRGMTHALVASELDLVPRAVGYYFRRKEDLAIACYARSIERMESHIGEALKQPTPSDAIRTLIELFFDSQRRVVVGAIEPIAWFEEMRTLGDAKTGRAFTDMFRKVRSIFSKPGAPSLERAEANARAHLLLSQLFWAVLWLPRYNPEDYPRMAARTADIILNGMANRATKWTPLALLPDSNGEGGLDFLTAGTELINEHGYLGASVDKIAARLNVTKGSFYHHNETKDELVEQCFGRTWSILRKAQQDADAIAPNALMNLASQAVAMIGGQVSGERPLLRTSALAAAPEEMRPRLMAGFDRITARYASVVGDGIADGSIRALDAQTAAQILSGTINAAAELQYWAPDLTPRTAELYYVRPMFLGILKAAINSAEQT